MIGILINLNAQLSNDLITPPSSNNQSKRIQKESNKLFFLVKESYPLKKNGREFLTENFINSTLIDFEGETFEVELRYRLANDEMQIIHEKKQKALYPQKVRKLIFKKDDTEQVFVPAEYFGKKTTNLGYFELLAEGKIKLLKQYQKRGKRKVKTDLFIQTEDNPAECFKVKKFAVLKLMNRHQSEISKFISENDLNVKRENDLKKVFDFYNSLP